MEYSLSFTLYLIPIALLFTPQRTLETSTACRTTCGTLSVKYPFGTGHGCGSPLFNPYITCSSATNQLTLTTHTGLYPITSISYATSTLTITPPYMSTCAVMQSAPNLGLDWSSPFQIGPSTFILLSCMPPTSSLTVKGSHVCDASSYNLCATLYTCPAVVNLGLPLFPPTNTCCVYSPANLNSKGELDIRALKCAGYASVVSVGDYPTDPTRWEYGVLLNYKNGGFDSYGVETRCKSCEMSGGACGYSTQDKSFLCACNDGFNSSMDCYNYNPESDLLWGSGSSRKGTNIWLGLLAGLLLLCF